VLGLDWVNDSYTMDRRRQLHLHFFDMGGLIVGQWELGLCVRKGNKEKERKEKDGTNNKEMNAGAANE
jgi:hypothetical protein